MRAQAMLALSGSVAKLTRGVDAHVYFSSNKAYTLWESAGDHCSLEATVVATVVVTVAAIAAVTVEAARVRMVEDASTVTKRS